MIQHFRIEAIVSLPYDAFRPFTSTKTCVVFAKKRSEAEVQAWRTEWQRVSRIERKAELRVSVATVARSLGWDTEPIFMAEPRSIGYKRRKNLPDLLTPNDLFPEDKSGDVDLTAVPTSKTVLAQWAAGTEIEPSAHLGFYTDLARVSARNDIRLDPKYRWLWDHQLGVVIGDRSKADKLGSLIEVVDLQKVPKGDLAEETLLIDLDRVESRQALLREEIWVDSIGSDKIKFVGCDLAFAKLEPYLGKVIINPPEGALGSTEWIGLRRRGEIPVAVLAYILMLPQLCEGYRRLQSGKRHARIDPQELIELMVEIPEKSEFPRLKDAVESLRSKIQTLRRNEREVRKDIDCLFNVKIAGG